MTITANSGSIVRGGVLWIEGCQSGWKDSGLGDQVSHLQVHWTWGLSSLKITTTTISPTSNPAKLVCPCCFFLLFFFRLILTRHRSCFLFDDKTLLLLASSYMEGQYIPTTSVWHIFSNQNRKKKSVCESTHFYESFYSPTTKIKRSCGSCHTFL